MVEDDAREAREAVDEWGGKAKAASRRADELRAAGNTAEADRFDDLAKIALRRQIGYESQVEDARDPGRAQSELAEKLKDGLNKLRARREELVQKRDELVSRAKMAQAQGQVQAAMKSASIMDPTSELSRFEERDPAPGGPGPGHGGGRRVVARRAVRLPRGGRGRAEVEARLASSRRAPREAPSGGVPSFRPRRGSRPPAGRPRHGPPPARMPA